MGGDATGNEAAWLDAFLDTRLHHLGHAYDDSSDADVHDFPDKQLGKAIPYGIYDVSANTGWVTVGTDHDTSAFRRRDPTQLVGHARTLRYPAADRLLICADGGGSNDTRVRAWKIELAAFAPTPACT